MVVDYYSRYIELAQLKSETADDVIQTLKSIYSRHGIPMTCISDNGPCFSSATFQNFATSYGFTHQTSSPRFPQANGASERAVQTAKSLLRKSQDPHLALLSYRTTPIINGLSPAQLLMGRQLRSTVPTTTAQLQPQTPDAAAIQSADRDIKERQATHYNRRHRPRERGRWKTSDCVWIPDLQSEATVTEALPFRSYRLRTTAGNVIRRNGRMLRHTLPSGQPASSSPTTEIAAPPTIPPADNRCRIHEARPPQAPPHQQQRPGPAVPCVTRSGRAIKRPNRLSP